MDILIKSVIAGVATAIILLLAKISGTKLAGAIGGVPIIFAVSYVFLIMNNKTGANNFLIGGIYGALAAVFFSLILIWLNIRFTENYWLNFAGAYILCFCFALGLVYLTSK